jgi:hypothetical protein
MGYPSYNDYARAMNERTHAAAVAAAAKPSGTGVVGTRPGGTDPTKVTAPKNPGGGSGKGTGSGSGSSAKSEADKAKSAAGSRYLDQAANLDAQAAALKYALETGFNAALQQNLADVGKVLEEQYGILKEGSSLRARGFLDTAKDTELATANQSDQGFGNLLRERQDAMGEVLTHGAGETDALRAMVLSARNWQANQSEGNRAYFDSMRSVNNSITDLNLDTKSALANAASSAESERERLWQDFYNRRSDTFTQLGNIYGQQRDYYAQAREMDKATPNDAAAKTASEQAFMDAAKEAGKSYVNQGLPDWIKDYKGQEQLPAKQENTNLAAAVQFGPVGKAEGATSLGRWA